MNGNNVLKKYILSILDKWPRYKFDQDDKKNF